MSKLFASILFSFFLFLHTTAIAEEEITPDETHVEVQEEQEGEVPEETEPTEETHEQQETQEEVEPEEALSEAEKEALAAEEAELREAGMEEEPVPE